MFWIRCDIKQQVFLFTLFLIFPGTLIAQENGRIKGLVLDGVTGKPLPYANVYLEGTSLGSSTDPKGQFLILDIPTGSYTISIRYIGYKKHDKQLEVQDNQVLELNFSLNPEALEGESINVTIQAEGQKAAINQQLSSKSIVNVVSSARIQELPDANAAESIGRLPGVSVTRVGGEGTKVVIRGMEPKYNAITVDGIRMASSDSENRSADLSMISSNMLEGIEVYKTLTADQDADVLGGTVNFKMKEAEGGKDRVKFHFLSQGGWTNLSSANNNGVNLMGGKIHWAGYDNYKVVPSIEGRILQDRLGFFLQANFEKKNLTSNTLSAEYSNAANDDTNYVTNSITLSHLPKEKDRTNAALVFDYRLRDGKISFFNFGNSGITEVINRSEQYNISQNAHYYILGYTKNIVNMITNGLSVEKQFSRFHANFKLSHSYSETESPNNWSANFYKLPAGLNEFYGKKNINPKNVIGAVDIHTGKTSLNTISSNNSFTPERKYMTSIDFKIPANLVKNISTEIKFGGKYRTNTRSYRTEYFGTMGTFQSPSERGAALMILEHLGLPGSFFNPEIKLKWFIDTTFTYGDFLSDEYEMHDALDFNMVEEVIFFCQDTIDAFADAGSVGGYARNNYSSNTFNYHGKELLTAGYIMATINIGQKLTIIPGIRYQGLETTYNGVRGQRAALSFYDYDHTDTTITVNHPFWLPNLNLRYKPFSWFDIRMAYSNTISYPDFNTIIPRIDASTGANVRWNNYNLKPSQSNNYDLYFTFYENKIGLFTIGGFIKKINDLIYPWQFGKPGLEAAPYYLTDRDPAANLNYYIDTHINNQLVVDNYGLEIDWQTHFWYLPNPFSGLVLNINYTHVQSEAQYPYVSYGASSSTNVDTSFTDRLIYQPNHIFNFSLGYDNKGFSIILSMLYLDDVFSGVSHWPQLRSTTAPYKRWDLSLNQSLPWLGLQLYSSINNISGRSAPMFMKNARDMSVLQMYPDIPKSIEDYGMTAEVGIRMKI